MFERRLLPEDWRKVYLGVIQGNTATSVPGSAHVIIAEWAVISRNPKVWLVPVHA